MQQASRSQSVLHILTKIIFYVYFSSSQDGFSLYIGRRYHPEPRETRSLIFSLLCLLVLCLFRPKQTSKKDNCVKDKPFRLFLIVVIEFKRKDIIGGLCSYQIQKSFPKLNIPGTEKRYHRWILKKYLRIFLAVNKSALRKRKDAEVGDCRQSQDA